MPKPSFSFCGYPIRILGGKWFPCGKIATPGCAYCDEHAEWPEKSRELLTPEQIIAHSESRVRLPPEHIPLVLVYVGLCFLVVVLGVFYKPFQQMVTHQRPFWLGVLVGSLAELFMIRGIPWLRDRWRWLRWFSWN
jgi:hypothetical protein